MKTFIINNRFTRTMLNSRDFTKSDGSIDWDALHAAELKSGLRCRICGYMLMHASERECRICQQAHQPPEWRDSNRVRCPSCVKVWEPGDQDQYELYTEGEHDVDCGHCDATFQVSTRVSHTFTSPKLREEKSDEPDQVHVGDKPHGSMGVRRVQLHQESELQQAVQRGSRGML